jgi:hypothetical protein
MGMRVHLSLDYHPFANQMAASEASPLERVANQIHSYRVSSMYPGYGPVPENWQVLQGRHYHTGETLNFFTIRPPRGFRFVGPPSLIFDSGWREQYVPKLVVARIDVIGISTDLYLQNGVERGMAFRVDYDIVANISP